MTAIEWTDKTWNPVAGCRRVHEGCRNCYAERQTHRLGGPLGQAKYAGLTTRNGNGDTRWTGEFRPWPAHISKPLGWKKPRSIFVNSMSDLFGEGVPDEYIAAVFAVMAATPQHRYVILTKRPKRAGTWFKRMLDCKSSQSAPYDSIGRILSIDYEYVTGNPMTLPGISWPLPNVAIGVSVSDQASTDEFLPLLAQIPTVAPIVSVEPMLAPVDLSQWLLCLTQVIIGAESGLGARPVQIEWVRDLARQVLLSGPALFVKQWPVCAECHGWPTGTIGGRSWYCDTCANTGQSRPAMTRKREADKTPRLHVPGYVLSAWTQPIPWPS